MTTVRAVDVPRPVAMSRLVADHMATSETYPRGSTQPAFTTR
jgi:hypothetical protein